MSKELDDNRLLASARKGDREAFRMLVDENSRRLYSLAWRILGDEQLAEDALQESLIKAYQQLQNFDGRSKLSTWLYRITTNMAIDMKRKMLRQQTSSIENDQHSDKIVDLSVTPERHQHSLSLQKETERAMLQLTTQERSAFTLKHHEGRSIQEIGEILGLTENSVKQAIFRAVKKLRQILEPVVAEELN